MSRVVARVPEELPEEIDRSITVYVLFRSGGSSGDAASRLTAAFCQIMAAESDREAASAVARLPEAVRSEFQAAAHAAMPEVCLGLAAAAAELSEELELLSMDVEKLVGHLVLRHSQGVAEFAQFGKADLARLRRVHRSLHKDERQLPSPPTS